MLFGSLLSLIILMMTVSKYINHQRKTQDSQQANSLNVDSTKTQKARFINHKISSLAKISKSMAMTIISQIVMILPKNGMQKTLSGKEYTNE